MGCDIRGVVEINTRGRGDSDTDREDWWCVLTNVMIWVERNYEMFARLFGVRDRHGIQPVAPDRGLPDDRSDELEAELDWYRDRPPGDLFGTVEFHSPSWITLATLQEIDLDEEIVTPGWERLFTVMELFAEEYGAENVRLVAWFDN